MMKHVIANLCYHGNKGYALHEVDEQKG